MATLVLPIPLSSFKNILCRTGDGKMGVQSLEYFDINSARVTYEQKQICLHISDKLCQKDSHPTW